MTFKKLSDQRNTSVFALIVKQPSKPCTLSKHPHWYNSDISTHHSVTLICVPENSGAVRNEIADQFTRDGSGQKFVGQEPNLESQGTIMCNIMGWLFNGQVTLQQSYHHSDRQSQQLISGISLTAKAR